jgi:hypothetical protein
MRRRIFAAVLVLVAGWAVLHRGGHDQATGAAAPPASAAAPTTPGTATAPPSGAAPSSPAPAPAPASAPSGSATAVPAVVGKRLTDAIAVLIGTGFRDIEPVDASGLGRVVVNPQNWVVRDQSPAAGAGSSSGAHITLKVAKPSDPAGSRGPVARGIVPNVVCADLQTAQDELQEAGFGNLGSADGLGQGRSQLVDRNWLVIAQSVPAGSRPASGTRIVLDAVKYGEPTGASGCSS